MADVADVDVVEDQEIVGEGLEFLATGSRCSVPVAQKMMGRLNPLGLEARKAVTWLL